MNRPRGRPDHFRRFRSGFDKAELAIDLQQFRPHVDNADVDRLAAGGAEIIFALAHHSSAKPQSLPRRIDRQRPQIATLARYLHKHTRDGPDPVGQQQEPAIVHHLPNLLGISPIAAPEEVLDRKGAVDQRNDGVYILCRRLAHHIMRRQTHVHYRDHSTAVFVQQLAVREARQTEQVETLSTTFKRLRLLRQPPLQLAAKFGKARN